MQQACRSLLRSFNMFAYYVVEDVTINVIIQNKSVIIKLNLISCLVLSLIIIKWLIMGELKELSNHILRNSKIMIFIKNWVLNHCSLWDSIMPFFQSFHISLLDLFQLSVDLVCLLNLFIKIVLTGGALLHTFPPFQSSDLKLFQW